MSKVYGIMHGVDSRHLFDGAMFDRLYKAEEYVNGLSPYRAYRILSFIDNGNFSPLILKNKISERII